MQANEFATNGGHERPIYAIEKLPQKAAAPETCKMGAVHPAAHIPSDTSS